jgi:hypothetical protein
MIQHLIANSRYQPTVDLAPLKKVTEQRQSQGDQVMISVSAANYLLADALPPTNPGNEDLGSAISLYIACAALFLALLFTWRWLNSKHPSRLDPEAIARELGWNDSDTVEPPANQDQTYSR